MPEGISSSHAAKVLDAMFNATAYSVATPYIKLHIGAPGAAGTTNPAVNTTRKLVSCAVAAGGAISNDTDIVWATGEVTGAEDYTHWTVWTAAAAGEFVCSGIVTANAVQTGDTFTIPTGDLDLTMPVAS